MENQNAPVDAFAQTSSTGLKVGAIGCLALIILIGAGAWYGGRSALKSLFDIDIDPTVEAPGDIRAFDPISNYPAVQAFAGEGVQLTKIRATYVRSDGTMDLKADLQPSPYVDYEFTREVYAGPEAPPIGAGVSASGTQWQSIDVKVGNPGRTVHVNRMGGNVSAEYFYTNHGMEKDEGSLQGSNYDTIIPDPTCSFADLWKKALERGAPAQAVAVIDYSEDGYAFAINDTDFRIEFGNNCAVASFKGQDLSSRGKPVKFLSSSEAREIAQAELATRGLRSEEGGLPPIRYETDRTEQDLNAREPGEYNSWYVTQLTEGSGVNGIFSAICLLVEPDKTVTDIGTYTHREGTPLIRQLNSKTCLPK